MRDAIKMDLLAIKIAELEVEKEQYKMLSEHYKLTFDDLLDAMCKQSAYQFYHYYLNQYEIVCSKLDHFKNELIKLNEG